MAKILYLVIPCYNEQEVLIETSKRLEVKLNSMIELKRISNESKIIFVDDGSTDKTWEIIETLNKNSCLFGGIKLSKNKGHQNALIAGLLTVKDDSDAVISLDADLQDDIDVIDRFVEQYLNGSDIVYGVRSSRTTDTIFKRTSAEGFYKLMKFMGVNIINNHADYRLMSQRALQGLSEFKEVNLFLRGIVPLIGYQYSIVEYKRNERFAGKSKYPLKKMLSFAFDGITSFSTKPIRLISLLGIVIFFVSFLALGYGLISRSFGIAVSGWTSLICSIWMLGGIQLLSIGIIGEYIGKIYTETKARPRYIIEKRV